MPNIHIRKLPIRDQLPHIRAMPPPSRRSATPLLAWLLVVIATGAWAAHFFYNGGRALADVARRKPINAPIDLLAGICEREQFVDFHQFSIIFMALLATLPFLPWLLRKPDGLLRLELVALREDPAGPKQAAQAALLCLAFSLGITWITFGAFSVPISPSGMLWIPMALSAAFLVELFFRGLVMRVCPLCGVIRSTVLYLLFFSALFPHGIHAWEPFLSSERFLLWSALASGLMDPGYLIRHVLPLLIIGLAMAWARTRSSSLWLVIGIQTGMLLAWRLLPNSFAVMLAVLPTIYVFSGMPRFRRR